MSKINVLNKDNSPTYKLLNSLNKEVGLDVLKRLRFEYGGKKPRLYKELAMLNTIIASEESDTFRNEIIALALPKIKKL